MKTVNRECERHGPYTAMVMERNGARLEGKCPKCMDEQMARWSVENSQAIAEQRERRHFEQLFGQSGIPERFQNRTFDNYTVDPTCRDQVKAYKACRHYAEHFAERLQTGGGLLLTGNPGAGKNHMASAIANYVMSHGHTALFMTVYDAIDRVKDAWRRDSQVSEREVITRMVAPELLILDEIGVQFGSGTEQILLFKILNSRYENVRPTILISNLVQTEISQLLGERIIDRMREGGGAMIAFTWPSFRGQAGKGAGTVR